MTQTFATEDLILNINLHFVGDTSIDPYICDYISSRIKLCVITFNITDELEYARALQLFNMLHQDRFNSDLKYMAQKMTLDSKLKGLRAVFVDFLGSALLAKIDLLSNF